MDRAYPDHVYELNRITIARESIQHEFRKLFPSVPAELWSEMDKDIEGWVDGDRFELAPVHDFWNAADGIMRGFKLKRIIPYVTAQNITWTSQKVPLESIDITWALPPLQQLGQPPYATSRILDAIQARPDYLNELRQNSDAHSASSHPRDDYRVLLFRKQDGRYGIFDGNRRVLRALIYEKAEIKAWTGTGDFHQLKNYWVSTGFLRELGDTGTQARDANNTAGVTAVRQILQDLFAQSEIARINFDARAADKFAWLVDDLTPET